MSMTVMAPTTLGVCESCGKNPATTVVTFAVNKGPATVTDTFEVCGPCQPLVAT